MDLHIRNTTFILFLSSFFFFFLEETNIWVSRDVVGRATSRFVVR